MSDERPHLHYDYSWEENEEESWLWIAEVTEPGLPEPHCYSLVFDARGQEAISLIQVFDSLSGTEAEEYAEKLAYG
jgi:hypothetical protein